MYEGMLSLMQMAKTSAAVLRHGKANLPYFTVLTHPTTAGVMASYATLGDVIIAEPGALIGFAGPRVIKETTQQDLPEGFQRSEFLLKHGLLDMVVPRKELKQTLVLLLDYMTACSQPALRSSKSEAG
jgi:acetyl-CoA carboxylase carboxyl transferase subunit beta